MKLAPFKFKKFRKDILITNDFGKYHLLTGEEFYSFINLKLKEDSELYKKLVEEFFIIDGSVEAYIEKSRGQFRQAKKYLFSATALHIFVVTNFCNSKCIYCQAESNLKNCKKNMDKNIAKRAVDIALSSPQNYLDFEFQGGEPLSNFEIIKFIIEYTEQVRGEKIISYNIVSNLTLLTDSMIIFLKKYNVSLSTSLDGNGIIHNFNRPLANGKDSYDLVINKIKKLRENHLYVGAIQTTTKKSLNMSQQIINTYVKCELDSVFLRPLTPLGYAANRWSDIGYTESDFIRFYKDSLDYILQLNMKNNIFLKEGHAVIFLKKIICGDGVNYMELRSPCGAAVGQMAYYYDGNIFTCDEARMLYEMGDDSFKIGNVFNEYNDLMNSKVTKATCKYSILEGIPKCSDCVYSCYCGTCPVINYALENDIISRKYNNYKCRIYEGMLNVIFEFLENDQYQRIFERWV